jgi:hypothetical protein
MCHEHTGVYPYEGQYIGNALQIINYVFLCKNIPLVVGVVTYSFKFNPFVRLTA